jgi:hypothetical protein
MLKLNLTKKEMNVKGRLSRSGKGKEKVRVRISKYNAWNYEKSHKSM